MISFDDTEMKDQAVKDHAELAEYVERLAEAIRG
jgi:hypothetical protein